MNNDNNISINESVLMAYINGELNKDKTAEVKTWLNTSEKNREQFEKLEQTWQLSGQLKNKPVAVNVDKAWDNVFAKIDSKTKVIELETQPKSKFNIKIILSIAAMLALVFTVYKLKTTTHKESIYLVADNSITAETLSDGSTITINENTSLSYPKEFASNERRVELKGEAFFEIKRNENKPFIIDLPHQQFVKVLGTSFNINAYDNDSLTTVFVSSGKVEFGNDNETIILVKGETGVINNITQHAYKKQDNFSKIKQRYWQTQLLEFNGDKLVDIVELLNNIFDSQIILACENTEQLAITTTFKNQNLTSILEVIAVSNNLQIEQLNNTYTLSCNAD